MADINRVYGIKRLFFNRLKIGDNPYEFSRGVTLTISFVMVARS